MSRRAVHHRRDEILSSEALQAEVFGSSSLIVGCADADELRFVARGLEGQLTATVHADESDLDEAGRLLTVLELKAGRILFDGWPTGVEVCHAMVHGGPFPATSDSRSTSVGSRAIERFLRPVGYQSIPKSLLPNAIGLGLSMHSNSHLGISLAAMVHLAGATPNLSYACDTHWPWKTEEVVKPGALSFVDGSVPVPTGPGLGVEIDDDALAALHEQYVRCGIRDRDDTGYMQTVDPSFELLSPRW